MDVDSIVIMEVDNIVIMEVDNIVIVNVHNIVIADVDNIVIVDVDNIVIWMLIALLLWMLITLLYCATNLFVQGLCPMPFFFLQPQGIWAELKGVMDKELSHSEQVSPLYGKVDVKKM